MFYSHLPLLRVIHADRLSDISEEEERHEKVGFFLKETALCVSISLITALPYLLIFYSNCKINFRSISYSYICDSCLIYVKVQRKWYSQCYWKYRFDDKVRNKKRPKVYWTTRRFVNILVTWEAICLSFQLTSSLKIWMIWHIILIFWVKTLKKLHS